MANVGRITHIGGEVLRVGDPEVRITHVAGEVLREKTSPEFRITHIGGEVLRVGDPEVRITHIGGEVLRALEADVNTNGNFFLLF